MRGRNMKKERKKLRVGTTVFVVVLFLFTMVPVNASESYLNVIVDNANEPEPVNDGFWRSTPSSGLIYAACPLIAKILYKSPYIPMKVVDWSDKPFPRPTLMWIGNGIGLRPSLPIMFLLLGPMSPGITHVDLYSDGEFYTKLIGLNGLIPFAYYEK